MTSDQYFLQQAYDYAASYSDDPDTKNGAVIVTVTGEAVYGANRLPPRVRSSPERLTRPEKYLWIEHAERDAIIKAARDGLSVEDAVMYCPWFACPDCARAIIGSGIREVVGHETPFRLTPERWREPIAKARVMLSEAGVKMRILKSDLRVTAQFDGSLIRC